MNRRLGQTQDALTAFEQTRDLRGALSAADAGNLQALSDLANSHERVGEVLFALDRIDAADHEFERNLELRTELARRIPDSAVAQSNLSVAHEKRANVLFARGAFDEAKRALDRMYALRARSAADEMDDASARWLLAVPHSKYAELYSAMATAAATAEERLAAWCAARDALRACHAVLVDMVDRNLLAPRWANVPDQILGEIAECNAQIGGRECPDAVR